MSVMKCQVGDLKKSSTRLERILLLVSLVVVVLAAAAMIQ